MQASLLLVESQIDRLLVSLGIALAFLAAGLLLFNSAESGLMEGLEPIGKLVTVNGVQRRHSRALSWSKIIREDKLYPKDMVYTPPNSSAEVFLNTSEKLILEPESMVEFDSVTSGTFNVVLVQGIAKIQSEKNKETKVLVKEEPVTAVAPVVKRPPMPMLFVDVPSWEKKQVELFEGASRSLQLSSLLPEKPFSQLAEQANQSLEDFSISLGPATTILDENKSLWYILKWSKIPLPGIVFEFEISREESFRRSIKQDLITQRMVEIQLAEPGKYFWRVKAKGANSQIESNTGILETGEKW